MFPNTARISSPFKQKNSVAVDCNDNVYAMRRDRHVIKMASV